MHPATVGSMILALLLAGAVVTVITNLWRQGNIDLTGRHANMRGVYGRAIAAGAVVAFLTRLNAVSFFRGQSAAFDDLLLIPPVVDDAVGIVVTAVVIAFISKLWNDAVDAGYEVKRWLRGKANEAKPEDVRSRPASTRRRSSRRRGGGSGSEDVNRVPVAR